LHARLGLALGLLLVGGCNEQTAEPLPPQSLTQSVSDFDDQEIVTKVYATQTSVPVGFAVEAPEFAEASYTLRHLRRNDLDPGSTQTYELCTDDMSQALRWSDRAATDPERLPVTTLEDRTTLFQITRQDATSVTLHRVFKCAYLNRDGVDPMASSGPAGVLALGEQPAADLRDVAEYLWQFSPYSNPGAAVLASRGRGDVNGWSHTLHLARRVDGAGKIPGCDRIELIDWHYSARPDGTLTAIQEHVGHFEARQTLAGPEVCRPAG
jgi:hypothetical protein